jgi:hypothetical protein
VELGDMLALQSGGGSDLAKEALGHVAALRIG